MVPGLLMFFHAALGWIDIGTIEFEQTCSYLGRWARAYGPRTGKNTGLCGLHRFGVNFAV